MSSVKRSGYRPLSSSFFSVPWAGFGTVLFDHCPILLNTLGDGRRGPLLGNTQFRFDANWILEEECRNLIKKVWTSNSGHLFSKLSKVSSELRKWSKNHKDKSKKYSDSLKAKLEELADEDPDDEKLAELLDVKIALNMEADKEELFWEQRARVNWLQKEEIAIHPSFTNWLRIIKRRKQSRG
ncbi:hypothetical protein V6N13_050997 [Hibiscus sabdariffa]